MSEPRGRANQRLRFGTRGSGLALAQTDRVMAVFATRYPGVTLERIVIRTDGDIDKTSPLSAIGGRGVFTSALEEALRRETIDAAVHSAKDLPSEIAADLELIAFPERADPRDVLVSRHGAGLAQLPERPVIGTSSRRRAVQVLAVRPDARIVDLRGNVDTRLRKALETELDGVILAAAGVERMGWAERITEYLPLDRFIPSPGQGALAVETRRDAGSPVLQLAALDDPSVSSLVRVERAFLRGIGGGCTTPVGANAVLESGRIRLRCMLASEDGARIVWADELLGLADAETAAAELARRLLGEIGPLFGSRIAHDRTLPLAGLKILVTRPRDQADELMDALRRAGAEPVSAPTIRIAPASDPAALDEAVRRLVGGAFEWVVFTSANAVDAVGDCIEEIGDGAGIAEQCKVAAVGAATAARLTARGIRVDVVPDQFDGAAVLATLRSVGVDGARVLLPFGNLAGTELEDGLRTAGAEVERIEAYRTVPETELDPAVRAQIESRAIDVALFASPSSVRNLAALLGGDSAALLGSAVACVGPVTAAAAREHGLRVDVVADTATSAGLVEALIAKRDRIDAARTALGQTTVGVREE